MNIKFILANFTDWMSLLRSYLIEEIIPNPESFQPFIRMKFCYLLCLLIIHCLYTYLFLIIFIYYLLCILSILFIIAFLLFYYVYYFLAVKQNIMRHLFKTESHETYFNCRKMTKSISCKSVADNVVFLYLLTDA